MYNSIKPGKVWLDTDGNRIQAHGGSVISADGKYYLVGENKEKSTPESGVWHNGVRLYSSEDLYNWKAEGIILPPEDDPENPLHPKQYMDRPHIIYNKKTDKFVMWIKIMSKEYLGDQYMVVAIADKITDRFKVLYSKTILGMSSGDFDLVCDEQTDKAYIYFDKVHGYETDKKDYRTEHTHIVCAELTDDYTDVNGKYTEHLETAGGAFGREAPAFFKRNGKMYLLTSGTTGYIPNPTECAVAEDYHGPWENIGRIHIGDTENLSFRSQISSVFKHPAKKDLYIAVADRWLVNLPDDLPNNIYDIFQGADDPDGVLERVMTVNKAGVRDTSIADYVWLPITFNGDRPEIRWYDEWKIEDFD